LKFKVGDRIRTKANSKMWTGSYSNAPGVIIEIIPGRWPYRVKFNSLALARHSFHANELVEEDE
jgi:hypothetical protein